ncbi:hypothetical protein [Halarchaeum sp. P4]|uniref:hypothetical protein n=1 Tax=Halarchaeum sp. P4 TaxID=3421639 RepID=UPI003EBF0784
MILIALAALYLFSIYLTVIEYYRASLTTLVLTAALGLFIVIDPLESGLYGYDPYYSVLETSRLASGMSSIDLLTKYGDRPLIFSLITIVSSISAVPIPSAGKYYPLVNALLPVIGYVAFRTVSSKEVALLSAHAIVGTRTFLTFESKFVPESLGIFLFFALIFSLLMEFSQSDTDWRYLSIFFGISIILTHNVTSLIAIFFLLTVCTVCLLIPHIPLPTTPFNKSSYPSPSLQLATLILIIGFMSLFIYGDWITLRNMIINIAVGTKSVGHTTSSTLSIIQLVNEFGQLIVVFFMCILNLLILHPKYESDHWELGIAVFNASLISLFMIQSIMGKITDLDQIRLIIFVYPLLAFISLRTIYGINLHKLDQYRDHLAVILLVAFLIPQLIAIPTPVLETTYGPTLEEDHFSDSQFAAANWASRSEIQSISGYERDVWLFVGRMDYTPIYDGRCESEVYAGRGLQNTVLDNRIYSNGAISINKCGL